VNAKIDEEKKGILFVHSDDKEDSDDKKVVHTESFCELTDVLIYWKCYWLSMHGIKQVILPFKTQDKDQDA